MSTALNLASRRQRAISRRSLLLLIIAVLLAIACQIVPAVRWGARASAESAKVVGAPPEAATRPNPSTEPLRGPEDTSGAI